jgi:hypothetical protein
MNERTGIARRGFLATLGALTGWGVLRPKTASASLESGLLAAPVQGGWDMSWLEGLKGKHRQVFDMSNLEIGLLVVRNWYDAHQTVYGLHGAPELNAVVGIGGHAFPFNASDALYQKFPIGELWKVNDPDTGKPATRNIFLDGGKTPMEKESTVHALQARGAIFWQCNNALHGVAARIGAAVKREEPEVYAELRPALNPGVILVPAHTMLIGLAQEHGCAYESV